LNLRDPLLQSATLTRKQLGAQTLTSRELVDLTLARIEQINPQLNAVVQLDAKGAQLAAAEADRRLKAGEARPLEGLPITIKDAFDVAGMISTAGSPTFKDRIPNEDAVAVARLRNAGAIIIGKTNVPFFSGDFQSFNPVYGTTHNPWDVSRSPGGSSGGAAAAVATGMSSFELGSDLGGSIRWPAHSCGIFGLKTTWNLVSNRGHVPPLPERKTTRNSELSVVGPLARSAEDLNLVLDVIAGPMDPAVPAEPFAAARKTQPKGLRVALWADDMFAPADLCVVNAVQQAARMLEGEGALIDPMARPDFSFAEAYEVYAVLNHAIVLSGLPDKVRDRIASYDAKPGELSHRALQARGARVKADDYSNILARRRVLKEKWAQFFQRYDVVLCPPALTGPIPHDQNPKVHDRILGEHSITRPYLDFLMWSSLATGSDLPAAVAPVLREGDGLPRGVQIIAGAFEDRTAVAVAGMIEAINGGFERPTGVRFT